MSNQLVFKCIDEGMGTNLKRMILALAAFKCNAVYESFKVDDCGISVCYRSVGNGNSSGILLALFL